MSSGKDGSSPSGASAPRVVAPTPSPASVATPVRAPAAAPANPPAPAVTEQWCTSQAHATVNGKVLSTGPFAGLAIGDAVLRDAAARFPGCPAERIHFDESVSLATGLVHDEGHVRPDGTVAYEAVGGAALGCDVSLCPRGRGIPERTECYEWRVKADHSVESSSDAAEAVTGETTWSEIDRERADEAWCSTGAVNVAKRHRLQSGLGIEKAIRRYVIETAVERLGQPDPLDLPRDLLLYGELVEAGQNAIEVAWKPNWENECHVYATPRLEGEDVARRMWGAALDWTIVRDGDGYRMEPADDDTKGVGR